MPLATGPRALSEPKRQLLIQSLEAGDSTVAAAHTAELAPRSVERWLERGHAAQSALDTALEGYSELRHAVIDRWSTERSERHYEHLVPAADRTYWRLWRDATHARARAETLAVAHIRAAGAGGGIGWKDVLDKENKTVRLYYSIDPDWRAEAWFLERGHARERWYRRPNQIELTGADGGPVRVDSTVAEARARVEQALSEFEQRRSLQLELEATEAAQVSPNGHAPGV